MAGPACGPPPVVRGAHRRVPRGIEGEIGVSGKAVVREGHSGASVDRDSDPVFRKRIPFQGDIALFVVHGNLPEKAPQEVAGDGHPGRPRLVQAHTDGCIRRRRARRGLVKKVSLNGGRPLVKPDGRAARG